MNETVLMVGVLVALCVVAVLLVLLLRRSARGGDVAGALQERDRALADLQGERDAARTHTAEAARLAATLAAMQSQDLERAARIERGEQALQSERMRAEQAVADARAVAATLTERDASLQRMQLRVVELERELVSTRESLGEINARHVEAQAHLDHAQQARVEMQAFVNDAQVKLSGAFAELAGKAFEERGAKFEHNVRLAGAQSRNEFDALLKPFATQLGEFRTRVDTLYGDEAKERSQLLGAVNELKSLNQDMSMRALELTRALKGSSKVRGDWGELMLESVLRGSGLEEGVHFERQSHAVDDEGARLRPDIVVRLPDDRRVVVDSKVNLIAWQEAMNADSPEAQTEAMRRHAVGLRQHVRDLGEKNYPKAVGANALGLTVAFIPIEGALSAALGADEHLQEFAFERHVVLTSPNTLMGMLRVVERMWTRDKLQRTALEISDAGGLLLDALLGFVSEFDRVGKQLDEAQKAFGSARGRLSDSSHAVIPRARKLVEKGVRGKKRLSSELSVDGDQDDPVQSLQRLDAPESEASTPE